MRLRGLLVVLLVCVSVVWLEGIANAAFPGRNGRIAFQRFASDDRVMTMTPAGNDARLLIRDAQNPAWSPTGERIAFLRVSHDGAKHALWIARADGSHDRRVSPPWLDVTNPAWAPGGHRLVMEVYRGDLDLIVLDLRSGDWTTLLHNQAFEFGPAWSPDGRLIVFASDRFGGDLDLYAIKPDGTHLRSLSQNDVYEAQPAWSPDGARIVFQSDRADPVVNYDLYSMAADGSDVVRLTHRDPTDGSPAWSPDGNRIVFVRGGNIFVMRPDGTHVDQIHAAGGSLSIHPDWRPLPG